MARPNTTTEMIRAAAEALIKRDTLDIMKLQDINRGWMQTGDEEAAMETLLNAILEAACLLEGEPSEIGMDDTEDA